MRECLRLARSLDHPLSVAMGYNFAATFYQFRREPEVVQELEDVRLEYSQKHDFDLFLMLGAIYRGWLLTTQGHTHEGLAQIDYGLMVYQAIGAELGRPTFLGMLADVLGDLGRRDDALATVDQGLDLAERTGLHYWDAELHRLKGDLLLRTAGEAERGAAERAAEAAFLEAIRISRGQEAKSCELRAATSLSRLLQRQGRVKRGADTAVGGVRVVHRGVRHLRPVGREGASRAARAGARKRRSRPIPEKHLGFARTSAAGRPIPGRHGDQTPTARIRFPRLSPLRRPARGGPRAGAAPERRLRGRRLPVAGLRGASPSSARRSRARPPAMVRNGEWAARVGGISDGTCNSVLSSFVLVQPVAIPADATALTLTFLVLEARAGPSPRRQHRRRHERLTLDRPVLHDGALRRRVAQRTPGLDAVPRNPPFR
jgi:hypothetical protein